MVGIVGQMSNRIGGFSITQKINNNLIAKIPAGSKILCLNCTLENQADLILNGDIIQTSLGFDVRTDLDISITRDINSPITILRGREIFHAEGVVSGTNTKFILPKGARINQTLVANTGEFSIVSNTKYLIEY